MALRYQMSICSTRYMRRVKPRRMPVVPSLSADLRHGWTAWMRRGLSRRSICLRGRGLPYTVFIAAGLVGKPGHFSESDLRSLAADPLCTFGAHTVHHGLLRFEAEDTVRREMRDSKDYLEALLGREVEDFAFPSGSVYVCSRANIEQVQACGFRRGVSTLSRSVTASDLREPWFLPRRNINDTNLQRKGF